LKVFNTYLIAINRPVEFAIHGVQIQSMLARDQRICEFQVAAQLIGCASTSEIVSGHCQSVAERSPVTLKSSDVISLPAMNRDRHSAEPRQGSIDVHPKRFVLLLGKLKSWVDVG
jgi:hypothetical protein